MKHSIRKRILALFIVTILVFLAVGAAISLRQSYVQELNQGRDNCQNVSELVTEIVDSVGFDRLCDPQNSALYAEVRSQMRALCKSFSLEYLYMYTVDENDLLHYVFCVASDDEDDALVQNVRGLATVVDADLDASEWAVLRGEQSDYYIVSNEFGTEIVWPTGYRDENGEIRAIIGAEINLRMNRHMVFNNFLTNYVWVAALLICAFAMVYAFIWRKVTRPVLVIADRMANFDPAKSESPLGFRSHDEIQRIADSFDKLSETVREHIRHIAAITAEQEQEKAQLEVARRIQNGLVPAFFKDCRAGMRVSALMQPARQVGGDFYDCFPLPDGRYCAVIGDVSGKGVAGALFMSFVKSILREQLKQQISIAKALQLVNDELCASNPEGLFVTVFVCVLDLQTGEVRYANAGHNPPLLRKKDGAHFLEPDPGIALGLFEDIEICNAALHLAPGDGILLYTDGVTEATNPQKTFFGKEQLLQTVNGISDSDELCSAVKCATEAFSEGQEQFDDITVVYLEYTFDQTERELECSLDAFQTVKETLLAQCGNGMQTKKAILACDEAFANIVKYSGASRVWFSCVKKADGFEVTFRDNGMRFDPMGTDPPSANKAFDDLDSGGMGIGLIRQIAPASVWKRENENNVFTLRFTLEGGKNEPGN